jgi:putative CocE/NonD family hydrolase
MQTIEPPTPIENDRDILINKLPNFVERNNVLLGAIALSLAILSIVVIITVIVIISAILRYNENRLYPFKVKYDKLIMKDGVALDVTYVIPIVKSGKVPVLLEYAPYRKDDETFIKDYPYFEYFGGRGFGVAKVDVRGTGSSNGITVSREYSSQEIDDGVEIIRQISLLPWCNRNVGIYGMYSNSLMLAARNPPELKTIVAVHGTHDLYYNDRHYIDGILHLDEYTLSMVHKSALPKSTDYGINDKYLSDRLNQTPWIMQYLDNQIDSSFWRSQSITYNYTNIKIPVYLIGGLYDGYRDSALKIYEGLKGKVPKIKVVIGPFNHEWPDESTYSPLFDGKGDAVTWFDFWLNDPVSDSNKEVLKEPDVVLFVRESYNPTSTLDTIPGSWRYEEWPIKDTIQRKYYLTFKSSLATSISGTTSDTHSLQYNPDIGIEAGSLWGDLTPDMAVFDNGSLLYDSEVLTSSFQIIGFTKVFLRVASNSKQTNWIVRLEEVFEDDQVTLITGAALNGAQRSSRSDPQYLSPGTYYDVKIELHYTTWTFSKGSRIRIAISNAMFPMLWPSPYSMDTYLIVNHENTYIQLPVIPTRRVLKVPEFTEIHPEKHSNSRPDGFYYEEMGAYPRIKDVCYLGNDTKTMWTSDTYSNVRNTYIAQWMSQQFTVNRMDPAFASWKASARHLYIFDVTEEDTVGEYPIPYNDCIPKFDSSWLPQISTSNRRYIDLQTDISLESDETNFNCVVTRMIYENGTLLAHKTFNKTFQRMFQ